MKGSEDSPEEWAAQAIDALGTAAFMETGINYLRALAPFVGAFAVALDGSRRPAHLYDNVRAHRRVEVVDQYLEGAYLLDPFYDAYRSGMSDAVLHLKEIAPDRFQQTAYYRRYYKTIGLKDEVGFLIDLPDRRTFFLSIGRRAEEPRFTRRQLDAFRGGFPIFAALVRRHFLAGRPYHPAEESGKANELESETLLGVDLAIDDFGREDLTAREMEIAGLILKGHSSKSIARLTDISPGTVKLHRKSIYRKLGITSQSELFASFLQTLG